MRATPFPKLLFLATIAAAAVLLFHELGREGIATDEATSTVVEVEMLRDGHWFFPTFRGEPDARQPPLAMWLSALSLETLGANEFALRFPAALLGLGTVALVFAWAAWLGGGVAGLTAALALVTVPEFLFDHCARTNVHDSPLLFFTTAAALVYVYGPATLGGAAVAGLLAGLALLSKGVAALTVLVVIGTYELVTSRGRAIVRPRPWVFAIVAFAVAATWFVPEWWSARGDMEAELSKDFVGRVFFGGLFRRWDFHLLRLRDNLGYWLLAVPIGVAALARRGAPQGWLAPLSASIILLIFTAAGAKYPWYALPAYPAIAVLVGVGIGAVSDAVGVGRRPLATAAAVVVVAVLFLPTYARAWKRSGEIRWTHSKLRIFEAWASTTLPPDVPILLYDGGIHHSFAGHEVFYAWKLAPRLRSVDTPQELCTAIENARSGAFAIVAEPQLANVPCLTNFSESLRLSHLSHASRSYVPKRIIPVRAPVPPFFTPAEIAIDAAAGGGFLSGWSPTVEADGKRRRMTAASAFVSVDLPDADRATLSLSGEWRAGTEGCEIELHWNGQPSGKLPHSGPQAVFTIAGDKVLPRNLLELVRPCGADDAQASLALERIVARGADDDRQRPADLRAVFYHFTIGAHHSGVEVDDSEAPDGRALVYGSRQADTPAFVFFVPIRLQPGHYHVDFWLRGRGIDRGGPAAILDVWGDDGQRSFARRELRLGEVVTASGYRRVELDFALDAVTIVQPRVVAQGGGSEIRVGGVTVRSPGTWSERLTSFMP